MIFNRIKGHPDAKVAIGLLASRKRVAALLDTQPENLGKMLCKSVENPIPPVDLEGDAPCQQVVHKAADPDFDLYKLVPAPTNTPDDAAVYHTWHVLRHTPGYWSSRCDHSSSLHSGKR